MNLYRWVNKELFDNGDGTTWSETEDLREELVNEGVLQEADLHTVGMIGKRIGLGINTVRVMSSRGDLPDPDLLLNTGDAFNRPLKLWLTETIDEWDATRGKR